MVSRRTVWIANLKGGEEEFPTKKEAVAAETEQQIEEQISSLEPIFHKYFRIYHSERDHYDGYRTVCVDCGELLTEWDAVWDGHRNERGDLLVDKPNKELFGGFRCLTCHSKAIKLFEKIIKYYYTKKAVLPLIQLSEWKDFRGKKNEDVLRLMLIVDLWHNLHKSKRKKKNNGKTNIS